MTLETMLASHAHVYQPAAAGNDRTLLLLHGTGGDEHDLLPLGRMLDESAARLSPRGAVRENGMPRFFRRIAEGVFDEADLRMRTATLADWVLAACAHYRLSSDAVVAAGFSNGANVAASMLLLRPEVLPAAVLICPMVPFRPRDDERVDLTGKRVLILGGERDPIAPPEQGAALAELLRARGATVQHELFPVGHALSKEMVETARRWVTALP